jgi:glycosyltransferase involved in cell wall biosynthesis
VRDILFLSLTSSMGGVRTQMLDLAQGLQRRGKRVHIVLGSGADESFRDDWRDVTGQTPITYDALSYSALAQPSPTTTLGVFDALSDALRRTGAKVIHTHALSRSGATVREALDRLRRPGLAMVATVADMYGSALPVTPDPFDLTMYVSKYLKHGHETTHTARRGLSRVVLPGMLDPSTYENIAPEQFVLGLRHPVVTLPGVLLEGKGWPELIEACALMETAGHNVGTLLFSIPGPVSPYHEAYTRAQQSALYDTAHQRGIRADIHVVRRTRHEFLPLVAATDVAVFPSNEFELESRQYGTPRKVEEGFGLGPPQTRSIGIPTVSSDSGGLPDSLAPELLEDPHLRRLVLVRRGDPAQLADAITGLLYGSAADKDRVVEVARQHARTFFTVDRMVEDTLSAYDAALEHSMAGDIGGIERVMDT